MNYFSIRIIIADHGNADQMLETKKGKTSVRTAHSLNPVPFIIYDPDTKYVNRLETYSWGQKVVRFYDPDGNLIEVGTPM